MREHKVVETICGLTTPQEQRFRMYTGNLSTDKDPRLHDGKMLDYIKEVCCDVQWVEDKINYLNSIGWNQSKYSFDQIKEQADRFTWSDKPNFAWNRNFKQAKERLVREFEELNLKTIQYGRNANIEEYLPREDTHAGWSYILTGKKNKGQYREGLHQAYQNEVNLAKQEGSFNKPILVGTRTQASDPFNEDGSYNHDYRDKSRLVSMVDIYVIMAEIVFAKRVQTAMSGRFWYAGGKDDKQILFYMINWKQKYSNWYSIDYSKYDQSIPAWLIRESFDVVRAAYKNDSFFDETLFTIVREDFINKVIVLGPGHYYESTKGVPSGSMFTQIIDSIANRLMIDTYFNSINYKDYTMMIMGDDNIIFTKGEIDLKQLSSYLQRNFGIEMNPDKCDFGKSREKNPEFLSRSWTDRGVYRKPEILLAKLVFPERYRDYANNKDLVPEMIVQCYKDSFPLGMKKLITHKHFKRSIDIKDKIGDGRWLTGLMRYRLLYAS